MATQRTIWYDSVPAWAMGPRAYSSKFGGDVIAGGIQLVADRLRAIKDLSNKMGLEGACSLRSSGHLLHEVQTEIAAYKRFNSPNAIRFDMLMAGMEAGIFPRWAAMTAPQFGFPGAERGGMISKHTADRTMARDLHIEAITRSRQLTEAGFGAGFNIWWPAWTSRRMDDLENPPMAYIEANDMMLDFWVDLLRETGAVVHLEWKPGDPGVDYIMTLSMAINFCRTVNNELGRKAMLINNEWAHVLMSGISIAQATEQTIRAGLFAGFFHANSGQKASDSIDDLLANGVPAEEILVGLDQDWPVGLLSGNAWNDQQTAIGIMDALGLPSICCEHDVNPAGQDPVKVFEFSILQRMRMLVESRGG